jgi:hypothetical membrane protein
MVAIAQYAGLIASVWLVAGIYLAARFYPGYSHSRQFCSELGASGSPTQRLSPAINNYPLGLLFCLYGWYLIQLPEAPDSTLWIGIMVVLHGLGTWVCGWFPMDQDPYTEQPTTACNIHSYSGLVMLISLIIAPAIAMFESSYAPALRVLSGLSIGLCIFFSYRLALAFKQRSNPGLHQRLSYGSQIAWLLVFSLFMLV